MKFTGYFIIVFFFLMGTVTCVRADELDDLYKPQPGRAMRSSSTDMSDWKNANADAKPLFSNYAVTLIDADGPGIINHIWMTIADGDQNYSRLLALRVYYDNSPNPSVEVPIGDFFAVGHGIDAPVNSLPVDVSSDGRARNSWWPMPFKKHVKITVTNEAVPSLGRVLYYYVDWKKVDSLPDDTLYFHAQYRQEFPCEPGDYTILETEGRGQYAGTVLSVNHNMPGWFGEGDDRFYIDGEALPTLLGTGTEDYFADAWGFRAFNNPYHGVTVWEGENLDARGTAYRWHIRDAIPFQKSLKVTIEHKGPVFDENDKLVRGYGERSDNFSSVAFWYQEGTPKHLYTMPKGRKRLPPQKVVEAEQPFYAAKKTPPEVKIQTGDQWSGSAQAFFKPSKDIKSFSVSFTTDDDMRQLIRASVTHGPAMGVYSVSLDGEVIEPLVDLYSQSEYVERRNIFARPLKPGEHTVTFTPVSQGAGGGDALGIDALIIRPIKIYRSWEQP